MDPARATHASRVEAGGVGILDSLDGAGADEDEFHVLAQRRAAGRVQVPTAQPKKKKVVMM